MHGAAQKAPLRDPVPENVRTPRPSSPRWVWQVAEKVAEGRLQAARTGIEEARTSWEPKRPKLRHLRPAQPGTLAAKVKGAELAGFDRQRQVFCAAKRTQSGAGRADHVEAMAEERQKSIDTLKGSARRQGWRDPPCTYCSRSGRRHKRW